MDPSILLLVIVLIVAFVPALLYLIWIRSAEIYQREPVNAIAGTFIYGLIFALGLAFVIEVLAMASLEEFTGGQLDPILQDIILAVVLAPVIEEFTKMTGVVAVSRRLTELENGLVYGAAVGLGFAAGENVLYYTSSLAEGVELFLITVVARTVTSTLLHTSASAIAGFGISRSVIIGQRTGRSAIWVPYYLAAVLIHGAFNFLAILGSDIFPDASGEISLVGLFLSLILVWTTVRFIRRKIVTLDRSIASIPPPPYYR